MDQAFLDDLNSCRGAMLADGWRPFGTWLVVEFQQAAGGGKIKLCAGGQPWRIECAGRVTSSSVLADRESVERIVDGLRGCAIDELAVQDPSLDVMLRFSNGTVLRVFQCHEVKPGMCMFSVKLESRTWFLTCAKARLRERAS